MAAAALTVSAHSPEACDWLAELERIRDLADELPAGARRAVVEVASNLLNEAGLSEQQRRRALALLPR